jgi:Tfp pilus assembly protein PilF
MKRNQNRQNAQRRGPWLAILAGIGVLALLALLTAPVWRGRLGSQPVPAWPANPSGQMTGGVTSTNHSPTAVSGQRQTKAEGKLNETINRANQLLAQDKPDQAVNLLEEARKLSPEDEDVHYNLGIALAKLGRNPEAVQEYQEALRIFPDYAEARNNLGNLLLRMGRPDEAVKQFEQAVKTTPDYAAGWNNFGSALQQSGQPDRARECFEKAAKLDTNYWQAHFNLGTSYLQQKRFAAARAEFETVLKLQPGFAQAETALERIDRLTAPGPVRLE